MNPLYSQLLKYVPPPTKPECTGTRADWDRVEKRIGVSFPADYRWIIETYGYGSMGDLQLHSPFGPSSIEDKTELEYYIKSYQDMVTEGNRSRGQMTIFKDFLRICC